MTDVWESWSDRFRAALDQYKDDNGYKDADIAEMLGVSRAALNHWANGVRTPQLASFFAACKVIGADPMFILFSTRQESMSGVVVGINRRRKPTQTTEKAVDMGVKKGRRKSSG